MGAGRQLNWPLRKQSEGAIKLEAAEIMRKSPRHAHLHSIDPSKHSASIVATLQRRHISLLFQIRTCTAQQTPRTHCKISYSRMPSVTPGKNLSTTFF